MIEVIHLKKYFPIRTGIFSGVTGYLKAVDDVSFNIPEGKTLGLVGESGCGKTTTGRTLLRLVPPYPPQTGEFSFNGVSVFELSKSAMLEMRRNMQIIFQDPSSSLDPMMTAGSIVEEAFIIHGIGSRKKRSEAVKELFELVGLPPSHINRYPHEFSGGQRQRIGIARAIALFARGELVGATRRVAPACVSPFIVCDEPISALDVSIQAQIINLLVELRERFNISYLFIAHDLGVVRHISDEVAVMYLGRIVERAGCSELFNNPLHPYTRALLSAIPVPDPGTKRNKIMLTGEIPSPLTPPPGCSFHPRCPEAKVICKIREPELLEISPNHFVSCLIISGIWS